VANGKKKPMEDYVLNYSRAVVWRGLGDMARKLAERRNDGLATISFWRLDMVDFWRRNHCKYLIMAHRLIAGNPCCVYTLINCAFHIITVRDNVKNICITINKQLALMQNTFYRCILCVITFNKL
jgi:hypothetical protein